MTAENDGDVNGARVSRLAETIENVEKRSILKFELGVVTIVGQKIIKATYNIEGDSCCALITYDTIQDCSDWLTDHYVNMTFPGVNGEIQSCVDTLLDGKETFREMDRPKLVDFIFRKGQEIIMGGVRHFQRTIIESLSSDLEVYKSCRYANPISMRNKFNTASLALEFGEAVKRFNRFKSEEIEEMEGEWPKYKRLVRDFEIDENEGTAKVQMEKCVQFSTHQHCRQYQNLRSIALLLRLHLLLQKECFQSLRTAFQ
jgi:hypothetical protein